MCLYGHNSRYKALGLCRFLFLFLFLFLPLIQKLNEPDGTSRHYMSVSPGTPEKVGKVPSKFFQCVLCKLIHVLQNIWHTVPTIKYATVYKECIFISCQNRVLRPFLHRNSKINVSCNYQLILFSLNTLFV